VAKKHEYEQKPSQYDQMLYLERMERQNELLEETNSLLKQLIKAQEPAQEEAKPAAKKTTTQKKDEAEPAEDKKGE
jgi:hypothetical protein